jgi:hypothetical protein
MSQKCAKCGELFPSIHHRCPPEWLVWDEDNWEVPWDMEPIRAADPEAAAEEYADLTDREGDYPIVSGHTVTVRVIRAGQIKPESLKVDDGKVIIPDHLRSWKFTVSAEMEPRYCAEEVTSEQ